MIEDDKVIEAIEKWVEALQQLNHIIKYVQNQEDEDKAREELAEKKLKLDEAIARAQQELTNG